MGDCGTVVDDLVEGVFFVGSTGVEDGEEVVSRRGKEESWVRGVQGECC